MKNDDSEFQNQSCDEIKRLGKQKEYCESKFLLHKGEEKTVECLKSFCLTCCNDNQNCTKNCHDAQAMHSNNNPEDLFIDVCSYKSMGTSFHGFCDTMLTEKKKDEYEECFKNFCFDCCSNELKITDFNNSGIKKCMKVCHPPNKDENVSEDATTDAINKEDSKGNSYYFLKNIY